MASTEPIWVEDGESWTTGSSATEARQEAYIEWLLTPREERVPSTKRDFAAMLEVTTQTLRNYARDPRIQAELVRRGRAINKVERASDVLDALYTRAIDSEAGASGVSAAKVWLDWTDRQVSEGSDIDLEELSKEDLLQLVSRVYDAVDESA